MAKSSTSGHADLRVQESLRFVAANTLRSIIAGTIGAAALIVLLQDSISLWPASLWLGALVGVGALRLRLRADILRLSADDLAQRPYLRQLTLWALASGLIWACAPWVLSTAGQSTLQTVVLFACVAVASGGAFASLAYLPTAFAIFAPPMIATVLYAVLDGSRLYLIIAGTAMMLSLVLLRMLVALNRQFVEQVELRERNAELLTQLNQRTADAEAANEAKSRFLAAASHDLRQPMHAIAMRSRTLVDKPMSPEAHAVALGLDRSVDAMQGLFDALLDISRLDAGAVPPQHVPFELKPMFDALSDGYAAIANEKSVDLQVEATDASVTSDPVLLERIVRQLLDNAMRHAAGSRVTLRAKPIGNDIAVEVRDTGKGIPRDQQQSIFKEFVQLDNPQRDRRNGLGLGLAIVDRLVRQLGHRLELESEEGSGACFRILVPAATLPVQTPAAPSVRVAAPMLDGLLIALLDDDSDVLEAMSLLMTNWRCEVIAATRGDELVRHLRGTTRRPDLLICDYRLAEPRNGRQVIDDLHREFGADIPALLITGDIRALEAAGDPHDFTVLQKPVRPAKLREIIAQHTGRKPVGDLPT